MDRDLQASGNVPFHAHRLTGESESGEPNRASGLRPRRYRRGTGSTRASEIVDDGARNSLCHSHSRARSDQPGTIAPHRDPQLPDLDTTDVEAAMRIVAGTARSLGVRIEE
ncbi:hypothetical protein ACIO14_05470 [Nocardia fluminea]|uniref:hypothetical protein n=1 Tax=Nocardia fluminea TaxID=134984 RepID=UPI0037FEA750